MTNESYTVTIVGRNVLVTEAMKRHAKEKLEKLERLHSHPMHITVTMDIEHMQHTVKILAKFDHFTAKTEAESTDMYVSIDKAVEKLQTKLRRWREKIRDHGKKQAVSVDLDVLFFSNPYRSELEEYNAEIAEINDCEGKKRFEVPHMTSCKKISLKELTAEEAMMKLDLSKDPFLLYRSEEDRKLKVMYRRNDGNFGIIQPE